MFARAPIASTPIAGALLACSLTIVGTAQGTVIDPPAYRWLEGERVTGFPFGYPTRQVVRYLEVRDGLSGTPRSISGIALRRTASDTAPAPAFDAVMTMRLSTSPRTAASISETFDTNHGADLTLALPRRIVSFPATGGRPVSGVAPFDLLVPVDVPFGYAGRGPLCVEMLVASHTGASQLGFSLTAADSIPAIGAAGGTGCGGLQLTGTADPATATWTGVGADPGAGVALLLGAQPPFAPGLDLGVIGAPGCALYVAPFAVLGGVADAQGGWALPVSLVAAPAGLLVFAQALSPSVPTLRASGATVLSTGSARVAGRVWAEDLNATVGIVQPVFGLVLEVR